MAQGKQAILKDQILITTEEIYKKVKASEDATKNRKYSSNSKRKQNSSRIAQTGVDNAEDIQEEDDVVLLEEIEVLVA